MLASTYLERRGQEGAGGEEGRTAQPGVEGPGKPASAWSLAPGLRDTPPAHSVGAAPPPCHPTQGWSARQGKGRGRPCSCLLLVGLSSWQCSVQEISDPWVRRDVRWAYRLSGRCPLAAD